MGLGIWVKGFGFRVEGLGFGVLGVGFRFCSSGFEGLLRGALCGWFEAAFKRPVGGAISIVTRTPCKNRNSELQCSKSEDGFGFC